MSNHDEIILPPMSRRSLEILFLLVDSYTESQKQIGTVIRYEKFTEISPTLNKRSNIATAISYVRPILAIFGFFVTSVEGDGFMCHKSLLHAPSKFDRRFHGAKKIDGRTS